MSKHKPDEIRQAVRKAYQGVAQSASSSRNCYSPSCCGACDAAPTGAASIVLGYPLEALRSAPDGSNLGLGCGNPLAIASLKPGETVLDLGSGAGLDAFLAAGAVGETGRVIGVDMTPEMVIRARRLAAACGYSNVQFHLGELESLPIPDSSVDIVISNCVINLSPEKSRVFQEAFRVLRPGGRLAVSDVVASAELPGEVKDDLALHASCIAGASTIHEISALLEHAGFVSIDIRPKEKSKTFIQDWAPGLNAEEFIVSANIQALRPL